MADSSVSKTVSADAEKPVQADAYAGQGGSYVADPATGVRRLVARTESAANGLRSMPDAPALASDLTKE